MSDQERLPEDMQFAIDYYTHAFALLHTDLERLAYDSQSPHPVRERFWRLVPPREYSPEDARPLLMQYSVLVEQEMAAVIETQSLAYWLHLYRRIAPDPIGQDNQAMTTIWVRATVEAAIEKYASFGLCNRIAISDNVRMDEVLNGLLSAAEFEKERESLQSNRQLVLTRFGTQELREFYDLEKLAHEAWRTGSMLRVTAKGGPLIVVDESGLVFDARSDELDVLLNSLDERRRRYGGLVASSTGILYPEEENENRGWVLLPHYNVERIKIGGDPDSRESLEKVLGFTIAEPWRANFIWERTDLAGFYRAHEPFAVAFFDAKGVTLESVLCTIAALASQAVHKWLSLGAQASIHSWQRAYDGPSRKDLVVDELESHIDVVTDRLGLTPEAARKVDLAEGIRYLELSAENRTDIQLAYPGPHAAFLPFGDDRWFIDCAWLLNRLVHLFVGVPLPDQNFKGDMLEERVRGGHSALPTGPCKAGDGEQRQIDAAFRIGDRLVIAECRAVGRSIGFHRGDPEAIQFRREKIEKALKDIDDKAIWLTKNSKGTNYDIAWCKGIVPVAVFPFVEYVPSLDPHYWLTSDRPRVLAPDELGEALEDGTFAQVTHNVFPVGGI